MSNELGELKAKLQSLQNKWQMLFTWTLVPNLPERLSNLARAIEETKNKIAECEATLHWQQWGF